MGLKMNIALCANDDFAPHLAATIASILKNSLKSEEFRFFILNDDFSEKTKNKILNLKKLKDCEITFIDFDASLYRDLPATDIFPVQVYFRLKIPYLIEEEKVLYLDSDVLVRGSLAEIYNTNIENSFLAAVEDFSTLYDSFSINRAKIWNLNRYFNSGVLLMNLKYMREIAQEFDFEQKCLDFIRDNARKLVCFDQDTLNMVCKDKVQYIDKKYNFQHQCKNSDVKKDYKKLKREIKIIHFVTFKKPWYFLKSPDFVFEYYKYSLLTDFRSEIFKNFLYFVSYMKNNLKKVKYAFY